MAVSSAGHAPTSLVVAMLGPPLGVLVVIVAVRGRTPTLPSRRFRHNAFKLTARLLLPYETLYYTIIYLSERRKYPSFERIHRPEKYRSQLIQQLGRTACRPVLPLNASEALQAVAITLSSRNGKIYIQVTRLLSPLKNPKNTSSFACNYNNSRRYGLSQVHVYRETHKEAVTFTSTPTPPNSAGARGQHRCAPGKIGGLAEAHTGSKRQWY